MQIDKKIKKKKWNEIFQNSTQYGYQEILEIMQLQIYLENIYYQTFDLIFLVMNPFQKNFSWEVIQ